MSAPGFMLAQAYRASSVPVIINNHLHYCCSAKCKATIEKDKRETMFLVVVSVFAILFFS